MAEVNIKYFIEDKSKRIFVIALFLSFIFHLLFLFLIKHYDMIRIDLESDNEKLIKDLTLLFPENKPKHIVENINENSEIPEQSDLLSDKNSKASNQKLLANRRNQPLSDGNIPYHNLSRKNILSSLFQNGPQKKFSKEALQGENGLFQGQQNYIQEQEKKFSNAKSKQQTTDNIWEQKKFSSDLLGSVSLSTYAWEWAPYINAFKQKLYRVWYAPPAFYMLGIIYGHTKIRFVISKRGELLDYKVLEHKGHESLETSSVNAIKSSFPFKPLPRNFPDETLTITALLIYPNLREGRN